MKGLIFSIPDKKYKKAFKNQTDRLFQIGQSKPVEMAGETFLLVGQVRLKSYSLISHFDIFNKNGASVDDDNGKKIHRFLSRLYITNMLILPLRTALEKLLNSNVTTKALNNEFKLTNESESNRFIETIQPTFDVLDKFIETISRIYNKDVFTEEDINVVNKEWNKLWKVLQKRTSILYKLYIDNRSWEKSSTTDQWLQDLYEEASLFYEGYRGLSVIRMNDTSITVDDLINHNYQFGRLQQEESALHKKYKVHRYVHTFAHFLSIFIWIIFLPFVAFGLYLDNDLSASTMFPLMSFGLVVLVTRNRIKKHLLMNVQSDLLEYSESIIYTFAQEKVAEGSSKDAVNLIKPKVLFETKGLFMGFRFIFAAIAVLFPAFIYKVSELGISTMTMSIFILINILLWMMVFAYPYLPFIGRKFIVTEALIKIQNDKFGPNHLIRIIKKKNEVDFHFYTIRHSAPYEIRIKLEEKKELTEILRTWTKMNDVPFHE